MTTTKPNHIGRNFARIRELRGMKQEALVHDFGISQLSVLHIEQSESLEDSKLEEEAKVLGVTKEDIENFSEVIILNIMSNSFYR